jgi:phosphoglycerol transferase
MYNKIMIRFNVLKTKIVSHNIFLYLLGLSLTSILFPLVFHVRLTNITVPILYQGDVISFAVLIKRATQSFNYLTNLNQGFPFGSQLYDYPITEHIQILLLSLILKISSIGVMLNIAYFVSYLLCTYTSLYVIKRFGVTPEINIVISNLFTFTFMHQARLPHYFLSNYFIIPLFFLVYLYLIRINKLVFMPSFQKYFILFCSFMSSFVSSYYAFFHLIVLASISFLGLIQKNFKKSFYAFFCVTFTIIGFILNLLPNFMYTFVNGKNTLAATRQFIETDLYSLRFINLFLPHPNYRLKGLDEIFSDFRSSTFTFIGESDYYPLGLLCLIGLLLMFYFRANKYEFSFAISTVILVAILPLLAFSITGGLSNLFSFFVTPQIRGYNRTSVFILFAGYLALAVVLNYLFLRINRFMKFLIIIPVFIFGFLDQTIDFNEFRNGTKINLSSELKTEYFNSDKEIGGLLNLESKGSFLNVYQMPFNSFPEAQQVNDMDSYYLARPYLFSNKNVRFSFPQMKGRAESSFMEYVSNLSIEEQILVAKQLNFNSVLIYTGAYVEGKIPYEKELYEQIPKVLWKFSSDKRWQFARIVESQNFDPSNLTLGDATLRTGLYVDEYGLRNSNSLDLGWQFFENSVPSWIEDLSIRPESETWGAWLPDNLLSFTILNSKVQYCDIFLNGLAFNPGKRYVNDRYEIVEINDTVKKFRLSDSLTTMKLNDRPIKTPRIKIEVFNQNRISPVTLGESEDERKLGIGISRIWLTCKT